MSAADPTASACTDGGRIFRRRGALLLALIFLCASCKSCKSCKKSAAERAREAQEGEEDDDEEEQEERDRDRDNFWRARIEITGHGSVKTFIQAFDCTSDGVTQMGECGPKLVKFKEMQPATMKATAAPGWRFDRWDSQIREPDGSVVGRPGRMPDGIIYLNGFGYTDTGELETVKAIFVEDGPDAAAP